MTSDPGPPCRLRGTVVTAGGAPQSPAVVTLCDREGHQVDRAAVDRSGAYTLRADRAGPYLLLVQAPGHRPHARVVALPPGSRDAHDVTLERLTAQVTGEVRAFPSGGLIPGAVVVATDAAGEVRDSTRSGPDGRYALGGLSAGPHTVIGAAEHMWPAASGVRVPGSGRTIVCDLDMLEPIRPPAGLRPTGEDGALPARWAAARQDRPARVEASAGSGPDR